MASFTSYDRVPYPANLHPQSHPERLAAMATLTGLSPPPIDRCRYLDLGCGDGAGVIAVAYAWPDCACLGVDLSVAAIARGQRLIDEIGLKNVRLIAADVSTLGPELGMFDYISAHGFYSWVPQPVRDALLRLCAARLAPRGLAFVSYEVYPGAAIKGMVRDIMLARLGGRFPTDRSEVALARATIAAIANATPNESWDALMTQEAKRIADLSDESLFHDHFAEHYEAVWFEAFIAHAARHGLGFVSEADPPDVFLSVFSKDAKELAEAFAGGADADVIARERATDIVRGRRFRQTILTRAEASPARGAIADERFADLYVGGRLASEPSAVSAGAVTFRGTGKVGVTLSDPAAIATLERVLECWPAAIKVSALTEHVAARVGVANDADLAAAVASVIRGVAGVHLLQLHAAPIPAAASIGETGPTPRASALARAQAAYGERVATLAATMVDVRGDAGRHFLRLLDGTRTLDELTHLMRSFGDDGGGHAITRDELQSKLRGLIELNLLHHAT